MNIVIVELVIKMFWIILFILLDWLLIIGINKFSTDIAWGICTLHSLVSDI